MGLVTIRATLQQSVLLGQHHRAQHGLVLMSTDWQPGGDNVFSCNCAHEASLAIRHRMDETSAGPHLRALSSEVGSAKMRLLVLYLKSGTAYKIMGGQPSSGRGRFEHDDFALQCCGLNNRQRPWVSLKG